LESLFYFSILLVMNTGILKEQGRIKCVVGFTVH